MDVNTKMRKIENSRYLEIKKTGNNTEMEKMIYNAEKKKMNCNSRYKEDEP